MRKTLVYCDVCGKEATNRIGKKDVAQFWTLYIKESNPLGDFGDGRKESYDVCSAECLRRKFEEYIEETENEAKALTFNVTNMVRS